jgi:hypothetical protein
MANLKDVEDFLDECLIHESLSYGLCYLWYHSTLQRDNSLVSPILVVIPEWQKQKREKWRLHGLTLETLGQALEKWIESVYWLEDKPASEQKNQNKTQAQLERYVRMTGARLDKFVELVQSDAWKTLPLAGILFRHSNIRNLLEVAWAMTTVKNLDEGIIIRLWIIVEKLSCVPSFLEWWCQHDSFFVIFPEQFQQIYESRSQCISKSFFMNAFLVHGVPSEATRNSEGLCIVNLLDHAPSRVVTLQAIEDLFRFFHFENSYFQDCLKECLFIAVLRTCFVFYKRLTSEQKAQHMFEMKFNVLPRPFVSVLPLVYETLNVDQPCVIVTTDVSEMSFLSPQITELVGNTQLHEEKENTEEKHQLINFLWFVAIVTASQLRRIGFRSNARDQELRAFFDTSLQQYMFTLSSTQLRRTPVSLLSYLTVFWIQYYTRPLHAATLFPPSSLPMFATWLTPNSKRITHPSQRALLLESFSNFASKNAINFSPLECVVVIQILCYCYSHDAKYMNHYTIKELAPNLLKTFQQIVLRNKHFILESVKLVMLPFLNQLLDRAQSLYSELFTELSDTRDMSSSSLSSSASAPPQPTATSAMDVTPDEDNLPVLVDDDDDTIEIPAEEKAEETPRIPHSSSSSSSSSSVSSTNSSSSFEETDTHAGLSGWLAMPEGMRSALHPPGLENMLQMLVNSIIEDATFVQERSQRQRRKEVSPFLYLTRILVGSLLGSKHLDDCLELHDSVIIYILAVFKHCKGLQHFRHIIKAAFLRCPSTLCRTAIKYDLDIELHTRSPDIAMLVAQQKQKLQKEEEETKKPLLEIKELEDPLTGEQMTDPVELPDGNVVDRLTLMRHFLHRQTNPFNQQPLTLDQIKPRRDLLLLTSS